MQEAHSIFKRLYSEEPYVDRFLSDSAGAVDVIIPIVHSNELWRKNLISIYREIPVNRLLLGDGGCIDNSLDVAAKFPRVSIFDHKEYKTLGYSIRKLVEQVETDWFLYLHSDVYIPAGWFDGMSAHCGQYDWFECEQQMVYLVEYPNKFAGNPRGFGFGGTQMGRKKAFDAMLHEIDDDFLYRNEDIIIRTLLQKKGFAWGFVDNLFHYHQNVYKNSPRARKITNFSYDVEVSPEEDVRTNIMQIKGYIKYLAPTELLARDVRDFYLPKLLYKEGMDYSAFLQWVKEINPAWLPHLPSEHVVESLRPGKISLRKIAREILRSLQVLIDRALFSLSRG
ncbi:glycosyl transferase family 2 [Solidesulfovibrio fructosivorans JJ]]|uniref:Glycosyl transferase family 2 n=1 Tax=Solidesulfovibrio fructosivorans JJ] TaxID=596151 RepID=E1JXM5_SOLFR|nr:glycosyltransferase family A protein [Solidesulfovibrio fructosivorans]EFL50798.1 glycosyl transferase family 2 [Solidesulfovibrio fructosivorans JJ]]